MKLRRFFEQFNPRFLLVRILVNALALAATAALVPKISFVDKSVWNWLLLALMLGFLNALLKPVLQFLTLQFIFVTYGLVIVLVNALMLWLLALLFPARFAAEGVVWIVLGGLILGILSSFLESLLGLTMPIVSDESPALHQPVEDKAPHVEQPAHTEREALPEGQAPPDAGAAERSAREHGEGPSSLPELEALASESMGAPPARATEDAAPSAAPDPSPEPAQEPEEDLS